MMPPGLTLGGEPFAVGAAKYLADWPDGPGQSRIIVRVGLSGLGPPILALIDTGAPWCLFHRDIAESAGLLDGHGEVVTMHTARGLARGRLERAVVTLLADSEYAASLAVDATVLVDPDWLGPSFIGYNGLLERIRFAVDPRAEESRFYFGGI